MIPVGIDVKVSRRGLYALKALIHLAERWEGGTVSTREIAEREEIPEKFLEAILLTLRNARVVTSRRGRDGGFRLRRAPGEIVVGDVVRLLDGPLAPFGDLAELTRLVKTEPRHAGLFALFLDVRNAASSIIDNTTLADLLERDRRILFARERKADPPEPKGR
jgi:Rrf2 family protein